MPEPHSARTVFTATGVALSLLIAIATAVWSVAVMSTRLNNHLDSTQTIHETDSEKRERIQEVVNAEIRVINVKLDALIEDVRKIEEHLKNGAHP